MKFRGLIYLVFIFCISTSFSQQRIKNIQVEIEYYTEKETPLKFFNASEDSYNLNLLFGELKELDFQLMLRMEDELSSEETYVLFSDVTYLDLGFSYKAGPIIVSLSIENLLNFESRAFAIEGSLEKSFGKMDRVIYTHEADFMVNTALTYNF